MGLKALLKRDLRKACERLWASLLLSFGHHHSAVILVHPTYPIAYGGSMEEGALAFFEAFNPLKGRNLGLQGYLRNSRKASMMWLTDFLPSIPYLPIAFAKCRLSSGIQDQLWWPLCLNNPIKSEKPPH